MLCACAGGDALVVQVNEGSIEQTGECHTHSGAHTCQRVAHVSLIKLRQPNADEPNPCSLGCHLSVCPETLSTKPCSSVWTYPSLLLRCFFCWRLPQATPTTAASPATAGLRPSKALTAQVRQNSDLLFSSDGCGLACAAVCSTPCLLSGAVCRAQYERRTITS